MKYKHDIKNKTLSAVFLSRSIEFIHNLENFIEDPVEENIHQSRVSGRKLESLFEAFGGSLNKGYIKYYKQIVNIIKLLSASRETDVCISLTKVYYGQIKVDNLLISNFLNHLLRNSKLQRKKIFKQNDVEEFIKAKDSFEKYVRFEMFNGCEIITLDAALNNIKLIITKIYNKVFEYSDYVVNNPFNKKKLHRMRLKAKPLRYLVEFSNEVYKCYSDELMRQTKELVEQAGLIHDIDMLIERVNKFSKLLSNLKHKDRIIPKDKSLNVFVRYLNTKRSEEFKVFCGIIFKMEAGNAKHRFFESIKSS